MKQIINVFILINFQFCNGFAQNPARSGTDHAVFFYVTDFQPGWEALPATKTDAEAIGKELQDSYGFKVEYVRNPSKADIENKIMELNERNFGPKDQLLLYFSMHGHFIPNANRGYLIPTDGRTPPNDLLGKSWLSYDDLGAYLSLNGCKHILLSLDACYSGAFGDRWMSYPGSVEANADAECRTKEEFAQYNDCYLYFTSGSREVRTPADSKFANRWLKALQEGRAKKVVTTNDLRYNFGTIENPKPEGGYFTQREKNTGDFVFIHKRACGISSLPENPNTLITDKAAWNEAKATKTKEAYHKYLNDFPNGEFRPLAENEIKKLEDAQREAAAWQEAKQLNTVNSYDYFIKNFPQSDYIEVADLNRQKLLNDKSNGGPFNVSGSITDEQGAPLIGASVYVKGTTAGTLTDIEGKFKLNSPIQPATLVFKYTGYEDIVREASPSNSHFVVLMKEEKGIKETVVTAKASKGFVFVEGGTYQMGSEDGHADEKPIHPVKVNDFYMAIHELTFDEYDAYCTATGIVKPSDEGWGRGKHPVINVSWHDAVAYCNWRSEQDGLRKVYSISIDSVTAKLDNNGYRLPTEAEWEYAARSMGKSEKWAGTSKESSLATMGNYSESGLKDGYQVIAPVGSFTANTIGLHDMSGNVWEWCWDWYRFDYYARSPINAPLGPDSGPNRVIRGGSWMNGSPVLRCTSRGYVSPSSKGYNYGFRLAMTAQ